MKTFGFAFSLFCSFATLASWEKVYQQSIDKIPLIFSSGSLCSGAFIDSTTILTAAHCVQRIHEIQISVAGDVKKYYPAKIIAMNKSQDLALLETQEPVVETGLTVAKGQLSAGQLVATIGHPVEKSRWTNPAFTLHRSFLILTGHVAKPSKNLTTSDLSVSPGNSGGPLLNSEGEVVGVVASRLAGFAAGDLAFSATPKQVRDIWQNKDKYVPPSIWRASHTPRLFFWEGHHSFVKRQFSAASVGFDFFDRIHVLYSSRLGEKPVNFSQTSLGWKFTHLLRWKAANFYTIAAESIRYKVGSEAYHGRGISFSYRYSQLPFAFKYTDLEIDLPENQKAGHSIVQLSLLLFF